MCVNVCFLFFSSAFLLRHKFKFIFLSIFYTGSCNINEHFGYTFSYSISIGMMMPFRVFLCNIQKTHSDLDLVYFLFEIFGTFTARVVEGSWRGRCCNLHTQLSTWGSFFSVVLCFLRLLFIKTGFVTFKVNYLFFGFRLLTLIKREATLFFQIFVWGLNLRD